METKQKFTFYSEPFRWFEQKDKDGINYYTEGYISTFDVDLVGDVVTKRCMSDMLKQMKDRTIKLDLQHETLVGKNNIEREAGKTKIPRAKFVDAFVDDTGLFTRSKLNKHHPGFKDLWGQIKEGFIDAHSIAYIPKKAIPVNGKGDVKRLLDQLNLLNVAYTGNPINPGAGMKNVFAKSLDWLAENESLSTGNHAVPARKAQGRDQTNPPSGMGTSTKDFGGTMDGNEDTGNSSGMTEEQKDQVEVKDLAASVEKLAEKVDSLGSDVKTMKKTLHDVESDIRRSRKKKKTERKGEEGGEESGDQSGGDESGESDGDSSEGGESGNGENQGGDSSGSSSTAEGKSAETRVESLEKDIAEIKAMLNTPVYKAIKQEAKAILEKADSEATEKEGPLDKI